MKFKIDENLPIEIAAMLRTEGYDATTVREQDLGGHDNPSLVSICSREERILVSLDLDFADLKTYPPGEFPGFMVFRVHQQSKPHLMSLFKRVLSKLTQESVENNLWIIEESRIRIRSGADF